MKTLHLNCVHSVHSACEQLHFRCVQKPLCELKLHFNSVTGVDKSLSVCTKCHCSGGSSRLSNWRKWTKHHHIGFLLFNNALLAWYFQSLFRPKTTENWGKTCLACKHDYPRPSSWLDAVWCRLFSLEVHFVETLKLRHVSMFHVSSWRLVRVLVLICVYWHCNKWERRIMKMYHMSRWLICQMLPAAAL